MDRYRLTSLTVKGFRGFPEEAGLKEFKFDRPCTLLLGGQRAGKSSTVTAVEWCLFGDEVAEKSATGIQERKRWLIRNKKSAEASVELTLGRDEDVLKVYRCDRKPKTKTQPSFYYQLNNGSPQTDEAGLRVLLGIELPDYMSCVHLHQEVISALLIEEPQARKNALDRLMGLDHLRNLLDGIKTAQVASGLREIDAKFTGIEQAVNLAIAAKRADLKRAVQDAQAHGIEEKELALEGAKSRCNDIAGRIQTFANDCGLAAPTLPEYQAI